jgi:hypothetical protein
VIRSLIEPGEEDWRTMASEREPAFDDRGQTGPEPRVATRDINEARAGQPVGPPAIAPRSVFVQRGDGDQVLIVEGDIYPAELAGLPAVLAEQVDGVWVPAP